MKEEVEQGGENAWQSKSWNHQAKQNDSTRKPSYTQQTEGKSKSKGKNYRHRASYVEQTISKGLVEFWVTEYLSEVFKPHVAG